MARVFLPLLRLKGFCLDVLHSRLVRWTKPLSTSLPLETLADLGRSQSQLIAENALLRKPLIILSRQVKRPAYRKADRLLLVLLARLVRSWKQALMIVQPDTRLALASQALSLGLETQVKGRFSSTEGRRRNCRLNQGDGSTESPLGCGTDSRGTLETGSSCVQANHPEVHQTSSPTPAKRAEMVDLFAQSCLSYLGLRFPAGDRSLLSTALRLLPHRTERSRRVIHVGVTGSPTDPWVAQQLREATPYGQAPKYLIHDNDSKFGACFARVATTSAMKILKTPSHAPRANAICERFMRSVRQECASPPVDPP